MADWYRHDIPAWMDGTEELSDAAYRAYHVIVQLIYLHEGPITLNERGLAGRCNQHINAFRHAIGQLLDMGKLTIQGGKLDNPRAEREIKRVEANRINAGKGGSAPRNSRINKEAIEAPLQNPEAYKTRQDESRREDSNNKRTPNGDARERTPHDELRMVLDDEHAKAVIDHRKKKRAPLTAYAAKQLAKQFALVPDPNGAADAMIANGWQGFRPDWLERQQAGSRSPPRLSRTQQAALELIQEIDANAEAEPSRPAICGPRS